MVMYASEVETKEKEKLPEIKNLTTLTKSNTVLNVFLSYFWKLFLTCFVK